MASSILRVLMCCWLLISQTGIDTSCCQAAEPSSVEKPASPHETVDEPANEEKAAPRVRVVNGLGQVIRDDSVCASGSRVVVKAKTRVTSKPGCHCSLAKKLAGKCCCSVSNVPTEDVRESSSTNPCGEIIGGTCQCADEVGTMVVLRMPTVLEEPCLVALDGGLNTVLMMVDDVVSAASLESALDPPELG
ncbi:hypothetical protein [Lacunimicrobium album]